MDPGAVFYAGNNPYARGYSVHPPLIKELEGQLLQEPDFAHTLYKQFPSAVLDRNLTASESNRYWTKKALNFIQDHPRAFWTLLLQKIHLLVGSAELQNIAQAKILEIQLRQRHFPFFPFSMLVSLALIGLIAERKRWRQRIFFYGGVLVYVCLSLIFYVSSRYRIPLLPFVIFFSCSSVEVFIQLIRQKEHLKSILFVLFVVVFAVLLDHSQGASQEDYVWRGVQKSLDFQRRAADLRQQNKRQEAVPVVVQSIQAAPYTYELRILANLPYGSRDPVIEASGLLRNDLTQEDRGFDFGYLLVESGLYPEARRIFEVLARDKLRFDRWYFCSPQPLYYLGRIAQSAEKDLKLALDYYQRAIQVNPGDPETLAHLSVLLERLNDKNGSENYRRQLFDYFDDIDATFFLGKAYWNSGNFEKSSECFLRVTKWIPEYREAHIYAAAALGKMGRTMEGIEEYKKAIRLKEDTLILEKPILELFRSNVNLHPDSPNAYYQLGVVLRQFGYFEEAARNQNQALVLDPAFKPAQSELSMLSQAQVKLQ
jgi:tetratricopeptide (TPR) repeat protein